MMSNCGHQSGSFLTGVRVLEIADELGEYCGKLLAGLGADVIKVEPPGGERTRLIGPFYQDNPHLNRSLHFWHYNFGKRGIMMDLDTTEDSAQFLRLASAADVVLDTRPKGYLSDRGVGYEQLRLANPGLVYARITPFGDDGPWAGYLGSDLIHLALGGVVMNCGYDPDPTGVYDLPPIAPQMWQAYHITGEMMAMQIMVALIYRLETGRGQLLTSAVHDAVSKNTETDLPDWIFSRLPHRRLTCRHSFGQRAESLAGGGLGAITPGVSRTKDGRWVLPYRTYLPGFGSPVSAIAKVAATYGMAGDLFDEKYADPAVLVKLETLQNVDAAIDRLVGGFTFDKDLWLEGQAAGMAWAPVRRPEENLADQHWRSRETFVEVDHPELGRSFTEVGAKWYSPGLPWRSGPRAPMLDEHTAEVLAELGTDTATRTLPHPGRPGEQPVGKHRKPFALAGVRVIDLSWFLASAGAGRFLAAHGAEVIKVEHLSRLDGMRLGLGQPPDGGRPERDRAEGPITPSPTSNVNRSGAFMEINSGKRGISLNLKNPQAIELLRELIKNADMVVEGFTPGTMEKLGLGYDDLCKLNPGIIYVQQSGMGQYGRYQRLRAFGPTAQAMSGLSDMSGLPEPYAPAGIGYSYLDWFGAYQMAVAMIAALYRKRTTGEGCWIDSSQVEAGIYLTGTAVLDYGANGRSWSRYGNRSPYLPAAPHGVYRAAGDDRWIAIAAFDQRQWLALARVLGGREWTTDPKLHSLNDRLANQDYLDLLVSAATAKWDAVQLMDELQAAGVPAGVCQTAEDRYEKDPQLAHLKWLVELDQPEIGYWPVRETPVQFSETPPYAGGFLDRSGPNYGQDNDYVYGELLGLSREDIERLAADGVI
jgi:crotonobetainyl-CoA:carnitine CoA-transferase CaiB-like acyl-CoA transferase